MEGSVVSSARCVVHVDVHGDKLFVGGCMRCSCY